MFPKTHFIVESHLIMPLNFVELPVQMAKRTVPLAWVALVILHVANVIRSSVEFRMVMPTKNAQFLARLGPPTNVRTGRVVSHSPCVNPSRMPQLKSEQSIRPESPAKSLHLNPHLNLRVSLRKNQRRNQLQNPPSKLKPQCLSL